MNTLYIIIVYYYAAKIKCKGGGVTYLKSQILKAIWLLFTLPIFITIIPFDNNFPSPLTPTFLLFCNCFKFQIGIIRVFLLWLVSLSVG